MQTSYLPNTSVLQHAPMQSESPSSPAVKEEREKTIPFLRQLTEMLLNNEELISFIPGQRLPSEIIHGKIIVHDRNRVQSEVLPIYFNHASFASLRRQLSYFSFVRVGKSRQSGVTYTNDSVVDLPDILKLKRRTSGGGQAGGAVKRSQQQKRQKKPQQTPPQKLPPQKPLLLPQQQQQQQHKPLATTAASVDDVVSAMLSGTIHAVKTNHNLDNNINGTNNSGGGPSTFNPASNGSSTTQSSITQSNSSTSTDNVSNKVSSSQNNDIRPKAKSKVYQCKGTSSTAKHSIPRKDRARYNRLLSINNVVPFIHLPTRHTLGPIKKETSPINESYSHQDRVAQTENKPKQVGRERAASDAAINALLALGAADRQACCLTAG